MKEIRDLVTFYDLSIDWQVEAAGNLGKTAKEEIFIEPLEDHIPGEHVLLDLSECLRIENPLYDGIISVSNNSAIGVKILSEEQVELTYI